MELDQEKFGEVLKDDQLLEWVFSNLAESESYYRPIWKEYSQLADVCAAEGMSREDKKYLEETGRPDIDPPFACGIIDTIVGAEMGRQAEAAFRGVDDGPEDEVIAGWLTQLNRVLLMKCNGHHYQMANYRNMLVGGYGFTVQYMDPTTSPMFPVLKPLYYWEVFPDPWALEENLEDADWFIVRSRMRTEDAVARWEGKRSEIERNRSSRTSGNVPGSAVKVLPAISLNKGDSGTVKTQRPGVTILTVYRRQQMPKMQWVDPETGEEMDTLRSEYESRKKELAKAAKDAQKAFEAELEAWTELSAIDPLSAGEPPQPPALPELADEEAHPYNGYCYYRTVVVGEEMRKSAILEDLKVEEGEFPIKVITGFPWLQGEEQRVRRYGMMRKLVDIQDWFTRVLRTWIELMGRAVKNGGLIEEGAFASPQKQNEFVKNSSRPGNFGIVQDGTISQNKVMLFPSAPSQPGIAELYKTLIDMFGLVSGVTPILQGTFTGDRSNVLVSNLQEQGLQMLAPIREPRTKYVVNCGRFMVKLALEYMSVEQIDKLLGVQKVEGVTVERNPETGEQEPIVGADGEPVTAGKILKASNPLDYDVVVDTGLATTTQRQAVWQVLSEQGVLKTMLDAGTPPEILLPTLFRNSPLPGAEGKEMADRVEEYFESQKAMQSQEGVMTMFQQIAQQSPEQAQQLLAQLGQIVGAPPPGAEQQQTGAPAPQGESQQ